MFLQRVQFFHFMEWWGGQFWTKALNLAQANWGALTGLKVWEIKWRIETSRLELQAVRVYDAFEGGIEWTSEIFIVYDEELFVLESK